MPRNCKTRLHLAKLLIMSCCIACIEDSVSCLAAGDILTLNIGGLNDGEEYFAVVSDTQGNQYVVPFTYDGINKVAELSIGDGDGELPPAVLNAFIGDLSIEIHQPLGTCVDFNMYVRTKCIQLSVLNTNNNAYAKSDVGIPIPA